MLKSPGLAPATRASRRCWRPRARAASPCRRRARACSRARWPTCRTARLRAEVLAITGTNGKTTTTALTAQLVERAGRRVAVAGNIGPTLLQTLRRRARRRRAAGGLGARAVELPARRRRAASSRRAAAVLNVTQDHLDWHGSMAAYAAAKARIFGERAVMVLNRDDPLVEAARCRADAESRPRARQAAAAVERHVVRFGLDAPQRAGDFGLVARERHGLAGARAAEPTKRCAQPRAATAAAEPKRSCPAPDAGRRAARARPPQRRQRARGAGAGHRDRLPARADAARPARVPRRAAPGRVHRDASTASTRSTTARAPTSAPRSRR